MEKSNQFKDYDIRLQRNFIPEVRYVWLYQQRVPSTAYIFSISCGAHVFGRDIREALGELEERSSGSTKAFPHGSKKAGYCWKNTFLELQM